MSKDEKNPSQSFLNKIPNPLKQKEEKKQEKPTPQEQEPEELEEEREEVVGETISFDNYRRFQQSQASATDLESVIMLRTAIAKGEAPKQLDPIVWGIAIFIVLIAAVIGLYLLTDWGIIDSLTGGGGGGGSSGGGGGVEMMVGMIKVAMA